MIRITAFTSPALVDQIQLHTYGVTGAYLL